MPASPFTTTDSAHPRRQHPSSQSATTAAPFSSDSRRLSVKKKPSAGILTTSTSATGVKTARITTSTATVTASASGAAHHLHPYSHTQPQEQQQQQHNSTAVKASLARHPLRTRDHNVVASSQRTLKPDMESRLHRAQPQNSTTTGRMPYDRSSTTSSRQTQQGGPQMPTVARAVNKPPLTPKIAARPSATTQHNQTGVVTPIPRRAPRPESLLSSNGTSTRDRDRDRDRDGMVSPMSAFLNNNVTPRSGSRQSRVESVNTTPSTTPNVDRHDSWETKSGMLGVPADEGMKRPVVTFSPAPDVGSQSKQDPDSKFFYASEAQKPPPQAAQAKSPTLQSSRPATFFYASGESVNKREPMSPAAFSPLMGSPNIATTPTQPDNLMSKFVYANGPPSTGQPPKAPSSRPSSMVSTSSKIPTNRPGLGVSTPAYTSQRPMSPIKPSPYQSLNNNIPTPRSPISTPGHLSAQTSPRLPNPDAARRPSSEHRRSGSLTIAEPPVVARIISAHGSAAPSEVSTPNLLSPAFTPALSNAASTGFASLLQASEDFAEEDESKPESKPGSRPESVHSPTKASSQEAQLTDLVANARRERKVQDLQITNASLEAINRTLERQLRKQTAEIRRFKRLSRSGRLSLVSLNSSRVASGSTVDGGGLARAGLGLDDLSEEESELEAEDDDFDDDDDLSMSGSDAEDDLGGGSMAVRDARHRKRDEERLQLDLSKHQQLLVDSQKMNQSLKRCLGWTEELIKEGKRALDYKVRPSDIEVGGRVLTPEEVEAREKALLAEAGEADGDVDEVEDADEVVDVTTEIAINIVNEDGEGADDDDDGFNTDIGDDTIYRPEPGFERPLAAVLGSPAAPQQPWGKEAQDSDSGIELPAEGA